MSSDDKITLQDAQLQFNDLMTNLDSEHHVPFFNYVRKNLILPDLARSLHTIGLEKFKLSTEEFDVKEDTMDDPVALLNNIASDIKTRIPFEATLPSETLLLPKSGQNSDCDPNVTVHVDGFLYTDDDVDELVEEGKLNRYFCQDCGSKRVKPLIYISHSMSKDSLYHIFNTLLPTLDGKIILDVGSRLGAVLYGAYVYTDASKIIGVEMNEEFCLLQQDIICKYKMEDRIEILHKRIEDAEDVVKNSDVVILNNVFEFYLPEDMQIKIWKFLRNSIKNGAFIVTQPPIETTFSQLQIDINVEDWLRPVQAPSNSTDSFQFFDTEKYDEDTAFTEIACYEVL